MAGMWIDDTTSVRGGQSAASTTGRVMGKEEFLKMLVAQLKNQNPLNPLDGTEFTAQLAQFSSLEQLQNVYAELKALSQRQASLNNSQLLGLIGREVTLKGNTFTASGAPVDLSYNLAQNANRVWVQIYDEQGGLVDTVTSSSQEAGANAVTWQNARGLAGNFTYEVTAVGPSGNAVSVFGTTRGVVTGVSYREDRPCLIVDGKEIPVSDVLSVVRPESG